MPKFHSIKYFFQVALEMKKKINEKKWAREKNAKKKKEKLKITSWRYGMQIQFLQREIEGDRECQEGQTEAGVWEISNNLAHYVEKE